MTLLVANVARCHGCPWGNLDLNGNVPCGVSGRPQLDHARADVCPAGRFGRPTWPGEAVKPPLPAPTPRSTPAGDLATFRRLWDAVYAEPRPTPAWWHREVFARLPCDACRLHTIDYMAAHPFDWSTPDGFRRSARGLQDHIRQGQGRASLGPWLGGGSTAG